MDADTAMSMDGLVDFCSCKICTSYILVGRIPQRGMDAGVVMLKEKKILGNGYGSGFGYDKVKVMINKNKIEKIVILGGGSAGWMVASALSKIIGTKQFSITLVESDSVGTVSVGEATIPQIRAFNEMIGIDENEFLKFTQGTFKQGIEFRNWRDKGHAYMHPFGPYGNNLGGVPFHHYWLKNKQQNEHQNKPKSKQKLSFNDNKGGSHAWHDLVGRQTSGHG